ncbi:MAG: type IV-A pilus assembly ATPase PilB, partial [Methylococcaceae bacterium]|nr:type IV-A pilus assembly ATPase PilB [Methylococcaceae bacterium]
MATPAAQIQLNGLAKCLIKEGLLTEAAAQIHYDEAVKKRTPFVSYLVANKILDGFVIASTVSREFGVPLLDLAVVDTDVLPVKLVSEKLIRQHHVLPLFKRGNKLFVAMADPTNFQALDEVKFHTRMTTDSVVVEEEKLAKLIDSALEAADTSMRDMLDTDLDNLQITGGDEADARPDADTSDI